MNSISDLASLMMANRRQSALRLEANTSGQAATTGIAQDISKHLKGSTMPLSLFERNSSLLNQQIPNPTEASLIFTTAQTTLTSISDGISEISNDLALSSQFESIDDFNRLAEQASTKFITIVNSINTSVASRFLFSGASVDTRPLPDGKELLNALEATITGITDAASLSNALDVWFDDPGGQYQIIHYAGSTSSNLSVPIDNEQTATLALNANSDVVRTTLKALAKTALSSKLTIADDMQQFRLLATDSFTDLVEVNDQVTRQQGAMGLIEENIQDMQNGASSEITRLEQQRQDLIGIEQFSQAARFEALLQQLDVTYRIAARKSETSLVAYLR